MKDEPPDLDPNEFAPDQAPTVVEAAAPVDLIADPNTAPHKIRNLPGYDVGYRTGFAAGLLKGRADIRAQDREDALDDFQAALRLKLFEAGIEHGAHLAAEVRRRVKRI